MTFGELVLIIKDISIPDLELGAGTSLKDESQMWLQVHSRFGICNRTGESLAWCGRRWLIETDATEADVVRTAMKALLTVVEHEAREQFTYKGECVFDPHKAGVA